MKSQKNPSFIQACFAIFSIFHCSEQTTSFYFRDSAPSGARLPSVPTPRGKACGVWAADTPHAFPRPPLHQQEKTPPGAFSPSILFVLFVPFAINNRSYSSRCRNTKQNHPQHHLRAVSRIRALLCLFQVEYRICLTFI